MHPPPGKKQGTTKTEAGPRLPGGRETRGHPRRLKPCFFVRCRDESYAARLSATLRQASSGNRIGT